MRMHDRLRYAGMSLKSIVRPGILEYLEHHIRDLERDNAALKGLAAEAPAPAAPAAPVAPSAPADASTEALNELNARLRNIERHVHDLERYNAALKDLNTQLKSVVCQLLFDKDVTLAAGANEPAEIDGLAVPPPLLRYLVAGTDKLDWFIKSGRLGAETLKDVLARHDRTLGQCRRILDFGCGCGRVTRHLTGLADTEVHGVDPNWQAVKWCQDHLRFGRFDVNPMRPPMSCEDGSFDLIYAFSIFTHLSEPVQEEWLRELRRILSPDGYLIITTHGDKCAERLSPAERADVLSGKVVTRDEAVLGSNYCMTWQSESCFRRLVSPHLRVVDFIPEGARGNPPQDLFLLAR